MSKTWDDNYIEGMLHIEKYKQFKNNCVEIKRLAEENKVLFPELTKDLSDSVDIDSFTTVEAAHWISKKVRIEVGEK